MYAATFCSQCSVMYRDVWVVKAAAAMAEWLRRWTWNPMGSSRTGSNPVRSESGNIFFLLFCCYCFCSDFFSLYPWIWIHILKSLILFSGQCRFQQRATSTESEPDGRSVRSGQRRSVDFQAVTLIDQMPYHKSNYTLRFQMKHTTVQKVTWRFKCLTWIEIALCNILCNKWLRPLNAPYCYKKYNPNTF